MASSETESPELTLLERLINSRNSNLSRLLSMFFTTNRQTNTDPHQDSPDNTDPSGRNRVILINPVTNGVVVIESSSAEDMEALFGGGLMGSNKEGQPPASKASIEAMPSVEAKEGDECVICLEELGANCNLAKEMPCKHIFHGECVEKWLKIHGSCPVCRYKMPVDDDQETDNKVSEEEEGERRGRTRHVWVTFSFGRNRATGDNDDDVQMDNSRGSEETHEDMMED